MWQTLNVGMAAPTLKFTKGTRYVVSKGPCLATKALTPNIICVVDLGAATLLIATHVLSTIPNVTKKFST